MAQSFFATLECECIEHEGAIRTQAEARMALFGFIEDRYNPHQRHSGLGYCSPLAYERAAIEAAQPDFRGTQGKGRDEIVAPARFYEADFSGRSAQSHCMDL